MIRIPKPATAPVDSAAISVVRAVEIPRRIAVIINGVVAGLGMRIKALSNSYETTPMLLYIIIIGIIGMLAEKIHKYFERKLTVHTAGRQRLDPRLYLQLCVHLR